MSFHRIALTVLLATSTAAAAAPVEAQGIGSRLRDRVRERVDRAADNAIEKGLDSIEGAIACVASDAACINKAEQSGKPVVVTDEDGNPLPQAEQDAARQQANHPGRGAWANFDFVPGERVLWAEDFSSERVGNFPRRLEFLYGSMELVEANGRRYLSAASEDDWFAIQLPETLPERFTMEWDMTIPANWESHVFFSMEGMEPGNGGADGSHIRTGSVYLGSVDAGAKRGEGVRASARDYDEVVIDPNAAEGQLVRMRVHVDGKYVKVYVNELRVANVPNLELPRTDRVYFNLQGQEEHPMLVGNISINAGGRTMYDALSADGRVATQGIYFDTGSDVIRPESAPTLRQIGDMLKEHGDLKLTIEGHTDNVGDDAANQQLSERRAAAVKARLESEFGIAADRLEARGLGESNPAAGNDTPEGRQQNRRVELVRR